MWMIFFVKIVKGTISLMNKIKILMVVTRLTAADGVAAFAMNYLRESDTQKVQIDFAVYYPPKNVSRIYG